MPLTLLPGYDTLVFGPYDHTGAFPRTAVRPDDPIQNRGHDTSAEGFFHFNSAAKHTHGIL